MILVDNVQKTPAELADMFGIPLKQIKEYTEFVFNENLKGYDLGSRKKRDAQPQRFPASFYSDDKNGISREIKYAASKANVKDKDGKVREVYSPKKVQIEGDTTVVTKLDLAIYFYLYPSNKQSPFRTETSAIWTYSFVDRQSIAKETIGRGDDMLNALQHAKKATGKDLKVLAKGMGLDGVDDMSELQIQAALSNLALVDPKAYLTKVGKQTTKMEGIVIDAVDKNVFKLDSSLGSLKWLWDAGNDKGQLVCEVTNSAITPQRFLINHVMSNLDVFYSKLLNLSQETGIYDKAEQFLKNMNAKEEVEEEVETSLQVVEYEEENFDDEVDEKFEVIPGSKPEFNLNIPDTIAPDFPTDFKSAMVYLNHYKEEGGAANVHGSKLLKAINEEDLQPSDIRDWVKENIGY